MPFVKLDCGILNSTLWIDRAARELFITALLMAEPRELQEEMPQIAVGSLEFTGWCVPVGWYGFVEAAGPGIVHRAGLDDRGPVFASAMEALTRLGEPEPASRSHAFDGRRLVRVDGGFIVLNFIQYREKDSTTAERSKRWRERQKAKQKAKQTTRVTDTASRVIRHQAEAEAEAEVRISDPNDKLTTQDKASPTAAEALSTLNGNGHKKPAATRSKRPIFTGQRLTVFEWFLAKAEQTLGTKLFMDFDIHEWFFTLDAHAAKADIVIPQRDNGAWLEQQLIAEAARRGLPIAVAALAPSKRALRDAAAMRLMASIDAKARHA